MTTRLFAQHHHHRHRRHKRFHVPREAKGIGYWKCLGMPGHGAHRAAEPQANPEQQESRQESQEPERISLWSKALLYVCLFLLASFFVDLCVWMFRLWQSKP